ncbi:MAG: right-handed parallel beta-helix repeat-containing protein [Flavobacteriales bacterium]|nr:right-handed parallel beta-helix repeat-containing protein [Flavobacteriales bacterium]
MKPSPKYQAPKNLEPMERYTSSFTSPLRSVLAFSAWVLSIVAWATTYYVSPSGNDNNSGTSQAQAWQTIDRVNQGANQLQPGDRVLFQRGATYRGSINVLNSGSASDPIEFGAYGNGSDPVISGSVAVTGWTQHSGNIWKAPLGQRPKYIFFNGEYLTLARHPNTGWLRVDGGTSTGLTDSDLNQSSGHWVGATAVIRTTQWSYDTAFVTASTPGSLTHTSTGNTLTEDGWGYFLRNKFAQLDAPGEWFYDATTSMLYLIAPDGGNPSNDLIEAAITDRGIYVGWQRHDILIKDLSFEHQTEASIRLSGTTAIEISHCKTADTHHGIYTTGSDQHIHHSTVERTFATGVWLLGSGTVSHCEIRDIATIPGEGENNWGYFGIRTSSNDIIIADNRIENIGYIGIVTGQNSLIERNVVSSCTTILNDGGGIALDGSDGLIIRNNIVKDMTGNWESIPPQHHNAFSLSHGIYFGNTSMMNTLVEKNTVFNCGGNGIGVDHTMISTNNVVKDNVLYNNRTQLGFTDYSNYNTPGGSPPYYVPSYNDQITGNIMYCLSAEQLCMDQMNVYSGPWVDFGTFDDNHYHNPYNEISILVYSLPTTERKYMTLEQWQDEFNEDANSARSTHRFLPYDVVSEVGAPMTPNAQFDYNINDWSGWPSQGVLTHDYSQLDNGALKVSFNNNSTHDFHFLSHDPSSSVQNGAWYRMKFSLVGSGNGQVLSGFKGWSQQNSLNQVFERAVPFSSERREITLFFQSDLTDNGNLQWRKHHTYGDYWIDNVELQRVTVDPRDPGLDQMLLHNEGDTPETFNLTGCWSEVDGTLHDGSVTIPPMGSKVLIREEASLCGLTTGTEGPALDEPDQVSIFPNPVQAGGTLQINGSRTAGPRTVRLFDLTGKELLSHRSMQGLTIELDRAITPGTYLVSVEQEGRRENHRLIVR